MRMRLVDEAECAQLAKYTQWAKCAKTDNRQQTTDNRQNWKWRSLKKAWKAYRAHSK